MRAAERREQLLDVTLDLVVERGFHAVTIEAVAQGAGVTRPIVYKQFTDLSGLVEALIDREEDRAIASSRARSRTSRATAIPTTCLSRACSSTSRPSRRRRRRGS